MEPVGSTLKKVVGETVSSMPSGEAALLAWPLVCGSAVAQKTRALECSGRVLKIQVPDPNWSRQLSGLLPDYIEALNSLLAQDVEKIEFVVAAANGNGNGNSKANGNGHGNGSGKTGE